MRAVLAAALAVCLSGCSCWLESLSHVPPNPVTDEPANRASCEELERLRENALWLLGHRMGNQAEEALDDLDAVIAELRTRCW